MIPGKNFACPATKKLQEANLNLPILINSAQMKLIRNWFLLVPIKKNSNQLLVIPLLSSILPPLSIHRDIAATHQGTLCSMWLKKKKITNQLSLLLPNLHVL